MQPAGGGVNDRPRLLDLYCGAGGAARGYQLAGFHVTGVDHKPQPRYAGDAFIEGDALAYCRERGHEFDAIHASPPCQAYSEATPLHIRDTLPDLIDATRDAMLATGKPYVIENVENARGKLRNPVMLCGTMFGLQVWRHRYFEIKPVWFLSPSPCLHDGRPIVQHAGSHSRALDAGKRIPATVVREALGVDWMRGHEAYEAIPPAYTEHIGRQLLRAIAP